MSWVHERVVRPVLVGIAGVVLCAPLALVGWLFVSTLVDGSSADLGGGPSQRIYESSKERDLERDPEPGDLWSCGYSPTYNDDWHDDVVCTNGRETDRPYLRPGDSFVTRSELMKAPAAYKADLNSGRR
jgi:hypothetical protein